MDEDTAEMSAARIKKRIAANKAAMPDLHEEATDLGLNPQPWWDKDFYKYAIRLCLAEREAQANKGGE